MNTYREYRWNFLPNPDAHQVEQLAQAVGISDTIATLLLNRNISTYDLAKEYFKPTFADLPNPFLMDGMENAVERILRARENKEKIFVFGDYDVDGTNGTAMLSTFLQSIGCEVAYFVPDRINDGYGVSVSGIQKGKEFGASVLLTVDCGVTAVEQVDVANSLGFDVIICDHHKPGETLPRAYALLDPLKDGCSYPYKYLCGTGVGFKFIQGICEKIFATPLEREEKLKEYLQFVVLATAADIVPLTGENRILLKIGLQLLNTLPRTGIRALLDSAGLRKGKITVGNIVFVLAPRINAVGRMGDAHRAIHLLISTDEAESKELALVLESENTARKKIDEETFAEAQEVAKALLADGNPAAFVLHQEHWHPGVIGIVASRIVEKYYRPTVMLTTVDGKVKGSARSVDGFDIHTALSQVEDKLLTFGGHKYAAGVSLEKERVGEFRQAFAKIVDELMTDELRVPGLKIDCNITLSELIPKFVRIVSNFAPFGPQNMRPIFCARNLTIVGVPRTFGKGHLRMRVRETVHNGNTLPIVFDAVGFGMAPLLPKLSSNAPIDVVFSLDEYEENISSRNAPAAEFPVLRLRDVRLSNEENSSRK